ncbi:hypothetical protein HN587_04995 [Candidatus Woesearchaeota archaeon]|nr:hypothetical protein [Candidatus Woesearchaeota archaeon]
MLFFGVYLCGREGYKAAKHWYYDLHKKSFNHVTRQTKRGIRKVTELNNKRKTKSKLKSQNRSKLKSQKKSAISKKK